MSTERLFHRPGRPAELLIRGAHVLDPRAALDEPKDVLIRQGRIAELAAGGQSNREIATMLFVTPKTVEYHLRNAYRKLDIETRAELAGALAD